MQDLREALMALGLKVRDLQQLPYSDIDELHHFVVGIDNYVKRFVTPTALHVFIRSQGIT